MQVHNRIHAERRIEELNVGLLAARGEKKDLESFVRKASTVADGTPQSSRDRAAARPAPASVAAPTAAAVAQAESVWKKRD